MKVGCCNLDTDFRLAAAVAHNLAEVLDCKGFAVLAEVENFVVLEGGQNSVGCSMDFGH